MSVSSAQHSGANSDELDSLLSKLRPFQREAFEFATGTCATPSRAQHLSKAGNKRRSFSKKNVDGVSNHEGRGRILLADEMGLGKTVTSLAVMLAYKEEWPLLILCPASLRYQWPSEIEKFYPFLPHSAVYVVKGFDDCDFFSNPNKRSKIKIVIATYSLLQDRSAASRVLQQFNFKCIIADESHNIKEKDSQRCKLAMPLLKGARRLLLLSGTPALARPVELWAQLHCIDAELFGSYTSYTKKYCNARRGRFGWDVKGISNADELHEKLKSVMVRRLKVDVLDDLPPKQRSIVPVKIQNSKHINECTELIAKMNEAKVSMRSLDGDEAASANFEARSLLMQAYQASGIAKAEAVASYVLDWLNGSGTQKLLVFAHHKEVMNTIEKAVAKKFKGVTHIRIDGSVPSAERASRVRKFQNKPQIRLGLLSMTAAGVGLTLTAATTVVFAELHWTPGVLAQAEDRTHRIGQVNSVNVIYCVCKEIKLSVDLSLWAMIGRKVNHLGRMIDGEKNASMNANDVENSAAELASFFAENDPNQRQQDETNATPVKGSIQSFFMSKTTNAPGKDSSSGCNNFHKKAENITIFDSLSPVRSIDEAEKSWACEMCTFINEKTQFTSSCEICGHLRQRQVTPCSENLYSKSTLNSIAQNNEYDSPIHITGARHCSNESKTKQLSTKMSNLKQTQPILIEISDNEMLDSNKGSLIQFKVSQNSGRIAIFGIDGGSLNFNFDIDEVITETTGEILEKYVKRTITQQRECISSSDVEFDNSGICHVVKKLLAQTETYLENSDSNQLSEEIKSFVKAYLMLREIEKKSIREYPNPLKHDEVNKTVRKIILESSSSSSTTAQSQQLQRYTGGSKERANENLVIGQLSEVDQRVLDGTACSWCGCDLPSAALQRGVKSTYCSHACAEEGRLRRGGMFASSRIREQLFSLEQGKCQKCKIDANALYLRIHSLQPAERLNALINANWPLPKTKKAMDRLLQNPKEGDFWQADHIVAVVEGGGGCGLDNLRTLCTPCHLSETEKLRFRMRLKGPSSSSTSSSSEQKRSSCSRSSGNSLVDATSSNVNVDEQRDTKSKKRDLRDFFTSSKAKGPTTSTKEKQQRYNWSTSPSSKEKSQRHSPD